LLEYKARILFYFIYAVPETPQLMGHVCVNIKYSLKSLKMIGQKHSKVKNG